MTLKHDLIKRFAAGRPGRARTGGKTGLAAGRGGGRGGECAGLGRLSWGGLPEIRPSAAHWPQARAYLTEVRKLAAPLIDLLHAAGVIYGNDQGGVVFLHTDLQGNVRGASVRAIHGQFCQTVGTKAHAWFAVGHFGRASRIAVTEGPIDALSFHQLRPRAGQAVVSVAGSHVPHPLLLALAARRHAEVVIALDNDPAGEAGAARAGRIWELFKTGRPLMRLLPKGRDWNEDLGGREERGKK